MSAPTPEAPGAPAEPDGPPAPAPAPPAEPESEEASALRGGLVKTLLAVVVNVGVLTALLVYFGWVRSERMADLLGLDEAILGMTVDDYVRRSVRSVVLIPVYAAAAGLAWVVFDQWWQRRRVRRGMGDPVVAFVARWLWAFALGAFALGIGLWLIGAATTFIAAPLVCAGAILLLLYAVSLRGYLPGSTRLEPLTEGVLRGAVAVLVAVGLFWTATNFATVEGTELAHGFVDEVHTLPGVEIDSDGPLDIVAPGVETSCAGAGEQPRYHYRGLRLLEATGGHYFLISDQWTPGYGVVVMLPADADGIRYTFVRDPAGLRDDAFPPCAEAPAVETSP
ncbi:hypothetical protein [Microbacterium sp. NPDC058389]|uniref:hypothetical protein n=1 Tax=Microbacterium sp. NPDC058389 TaxID=3346475 RepID=UPI0036516072